MAYVEAIDRNQIMICTLDSLVADESIARIIDAFINGLDIVELGITKAIPANEGRPAYDPGSLLKLYLYGSRKSIRSSRKLAEACKVNIEIRWMTGGIEPDFRTISDFRKDNVKNLKKVFHTFNRRLAEVLPSGLKSVDGSKFNANNSKDNNFTASKLDDRITWLNNHTDEYLRLLAELDEADDEAITTGQFTREEVEEKLKEAAERLARYESYRNYMEANGLAQISLTDPDSRLMKSKNGFVVGYNVQTSVDSETHMINDYNLTNNATDHGQLYPTLKDQRDDEGGIVEGIADKGYQVEADMIECLENGIIPHVALDDGKDSYELELAHEEALDAELRKDSTKSEDLKKCLRAGEIPGAYREVIEKSEVIETRKWIKEESEEENEILSPYGSTEEMLERAAEGYFVRDPERNCVYCPNGETLRQKCVKKNGNVRYANKTACRRCKHRDKCCKGKCEWKEIDFTKDTLEKPVKGWQGKDELAKHEPKQRKGHYEKVKVVKLTLRPDRQKMDKRKCTSEHPFGTIKRAMTASHFLLETLEKVDGEFALWALGYNLEVAKNLLGFDKMMEVMA